MNSLCNFNAQILHSERCNFPVVPVSLAFKAVRNRNFRTIGLRNADDEIEVYLCSPDGTHIARVDFEEWRSEVCV